MPGARTIDETSTEWQRGHTWCPFKILCLLASGVLAFCGDSANAENPSYSIVDLGKFTEATAINDTGDVVGNLRAADGQTHAFFYTNGKMTDLGTFGGSMSFAKGINATREIVGVVRIDVDNEHHHPSLHGFLYSQGMVRPLALVDSQPIDAVLASADDINASGQIAVQVYSQHGAIWSKGAVIRLGTFVQKGIGVPMGKAISPDGSARVLISYDEGYVVPHRINDAGDVVGLAKMANGDEHAFFYSKGALQDLGALGGKGSQASDINASGQIVGRFRTAEEHIHAFLYANGKMSDLGVPSGFVNGVASGINSSGEIVGNAYTIVGGGFLRIDEHAHAFRYKDGCWIDLMTCVNLAGTELTELFMATRINARGQIIGQATGAGAYHAYLLTPDDASGKGR